MLSSCNWDGGASPTIELNIDTKGYVVPPPQQRFTGDLFISFRGGGQDELDWEPPKRSTKVKSLGKEEDEEENFDPGCVPIHFPG